MSNDTIKKIQAGERIITKGNPADAAYVILEGKVRVFLEKDGKTVRLTELGPQAMFGEAALFGRNTYGANVEALEQTEISVITPENFKTKIDDCDPMLRTIINTLIDRQRKTNEALLESETREFMDIGFI